MLSYTHFTRIERIKLEELKKKGKSMEEHFDAPIYFAKPHAPWQRGTNENTNGLLRFFFPKGFDFRTISDEDFDRVIDLLNHRPRKCLGWKTSAEVFFESVALD